jgi:TPR repeat protein
MRGAAVLILALVVVACVHTREARGFLRENGYTEIAFTSSSSGHKLGFTAKNAAGQHCKGEIDTTDESTHNAICTWECTKTDWVGCWSRGKLLEPTAPAKALDDYATGCEAGNAPSCARAGVIYEEGIGGVSKDAAKSFAFDKKACDLGDAPSCVSVALDDDTGSGTTQDHAAAFRAAEMACTNKLMRGCEIAGNALLQGSGAPRDAIGGADRLERACASGDANGACVLLGTALVAGTYLTKDLARGEHLLDLACKKNHPVACFELGQFLADKTVTDPNGLTAKDCFNRGCNLGDQPSCSKVLR